MNIKKIFKFFSVIFIMLIGVIYGTSKVNAAATRGDIVSGKYLSGPYYVMHEKPSGAHMWLQAQFIIRTSDGQFVYCVQPYVTIKEDNSYNVTTEDVAAVANISQANWDKIARIAYYGYGYKDATHDHTSDKWYIAAQMLIWNLADPSIDSYFTNTLKGTRNDSILKAEQDEIMSLVNNHLTRPVLNDLPSTMTIGQTITVNDSNNVLNNFTLSNIQNGEVTKNGNSLTIKATNVGTLSFSLNKLNNIYGNPIQLYYAVDSQNVMRRGDIDPIRVAKNITVYGGDITIHKTDNETIENKPQGEGRLDGAVYGVYKEDGTKVGTITTNSEGYSKSDYLPSLGRFYVLEEKPSLGYELDKNKYYFDVTPENLHPDIQVFEQVIRRKFEITKVYASAETKIMIPEVGVKFGIYNNKGYLVKEFTTDEQGNFEFSLPYGTYTVKQLTTTKGHEKMKEFNIEVTSKGNTIKKVISNAEITAKLKVIKIDSETKEVIKRSGIKFKILDTKTNKYVCQTITYPNKKTVCEFETDENGEFTTAYPLQSGTYKLEEIDQKIDGYLWNKESKEFTIDENSKLVEDEEYGIIFETTFGNTSVKGKVEIKKLGEVAKLEEGKGYTYTDEILSGIEFGLYQNDKLITKGVTNDKGELVFSNLKLGNYCVIELKTREGYILNDKPVCFELKYKDQYTPEVTYKTTINNKLNTSKFEFTKTDYSTDETLPNTTIKIYTINDELVYEGKTDSEGKIVIDRLPIGKYYIEESEAPEGYLINDEKMYFEVKGEEIVKSTMKDEKITGTLEFTKTDFSESVTLPNTTIEIYNDKDELVFTGVTDENGKIVIEKLEYGKYYILEKEAPEGYTINEERMYFEIKENGEIVKCTMKDEKIIEVPNTNENRNYDLEIGSLLLVAFGAGVIIYGKIKNKKNK